MRCLYCLLIVVCCVLRVDYRGTCVLCSVLCAVSVMCVSRVVSVARVVGFVYFFVIIVCVRVRGTSCDC